MENGQEWKSQMTVLAKMGLTLYLSRKQPLFTCTQIYLRLLKSKKLIIVHCQTPTIYHYKCLASNKDFFTVRMKIFSQAKIF